MNKTIKEKLEEALGETSLRWKVLSMLGDRPCVCVYYPSEQAFIETCSKSRGGPALTKDGEIMSQEAHRIRRVILETIPTAIVGFEIETTSREGGAQ